MKISHILLALLLPFSSILSAEPIDNENPFFRCTTTSNKIIELKRQDDKFIYTFGSPNQPPELAMNKSPHEVEISMGNLSGNELSNSVSLTNGAYTYTVIMKINRIADTQEPEHGIVVKKNSRYLAYIPCIANSVQGSLLDFE
ncbi:MAG: hypothetical protein OJI67_05415 [Prosthecobacter sp.]|nr:hypothetical protein [Prosthecobacter sp.]